MAIEHLEKITLVGLWFLPLSVAVLLAVAHRSEERFLRVLSRAGMLSFAMLFLAQLIFSALSGWQPLRIELFKLISTGEYEFTFSQRWDAIGAAFVFCTAFCGNIIVHFSRYYLHREPGYARFQSLIFLLVAAVVLMATADDLHVFFSGWELIGIASFLLIGFYRERPATVRNALTVFVVYRIGDLGLFFGAWLSHLLHWSSDISFTDLERLTTQTLPQFRSILILVGFMMILAATAKSAQFPFQFCLPKAMEGPTPSSAIFYGALSVHVGVLLLLRTEPLWAGVLELKILLGGLGLFSAAMAALCGRTQASIKGQLAYASVAQVGLMFFELAIGLRAFVLYHFLAHAFFRCFQLLASPSILANVMRQQTRIHEVRVPGSWSIEAWYPKRLAASLYVLAFNDGYSEAALRRCIVLPVLKLGEWGGQLSAFRLVFFLSLTLLAAGVLTFSGLTLAGIYLLIAGQLFFAFIAIACEGSVFLLLTHLLLSYLMAAIAGGFASGEYSISALFLGSIFPVWIVTLALVRKMGAQNFKGLDELGGFFARQPAPMWGIFVAACVLAAVPPSPTFVTEDLLIHKLAQLSLIAAGLSAAALSICGIALFRAVALLGMGRDQSSHP